MKILIVDDEPLIHISIEVSLNELDDKNLQIIHANNGSEMLQKMETCDIDIALVDIRMPGMDGLTAIGKARERFPNTHYYIMSGFSEFEYAREACRLNVVEYLLKPLAPEQLADIVEKVKREKSHEEEQIRESFHAWLAGTLHLHDVSSLFDKSYYSAVILFTYDSCNNINSNWVPDLFKKNNVSMISIPCWEGQLLFVYDRDNKVLEELLHSFPYKHYPDGITCFITHFSNDPVLLSKEMHKILELSPLRILRGIGKLYKVNQFPEENKDEIRKGMDWIELRDCLFEKKYSDFVTKSAVLTPALSDLAPVQRRNLIHFLEAVTGKHIPESDSVEAISDFLKKNGEIMIQRESGGDRIDAVIEYVQENYREDISISQLASRFDLTPNYLSALIKKRLGVNFIEFITSLRIAKAKELLGSEDLSVREVGEAVGYYSTSYFTKAFIKRERMTPGEYRKNLGKS